MSLFNRKAKNSDYSSYSSTSEQWNQDKFDSKDVDDIEADDTEYYDSSIQFDEELSNGSLVFLIVDDDYNHAGGYVVVSPSGIPTVIDDDFYEMTDRDREHLESLAKAFFEATRK